MRGLCISFTSSSLFLVGGWSNTFEDKRRKGGGGGQGEGIRKSSTRGEGTNLRGGGGWLFLLGRGSVPHYMSCYVFAEPSNLL